MLAEQYFSGLVVLIERLRMSQMENIRRAAEEIAPRLEKGGILYVFGSGHSHVLAEELFIRAGGLVQARAILPYEITMDRTPEKGMQLERCDGYAEVILNSTPLRSLDALIVISNSGRNAVPVEMALGAKKRGIFTVALTNLTHSKGTAPRNKAGKKLYEAADVVLDNCGPLGDALIQPPGKRWSVGPVSTIVGAALLEALVCDITEIMLERGVEPPLYRSANVDGADDYNRAVLRELKERYPEYREMGFHL
jgi:uncharacterized phosphosugar-binding protein